VILDYLCEAPEGKPRAGGDVTDVAFGTEEELEQFRLTPAATRVLRKAFELARARALDDSQTSPKLLSHASVSARCLQNLDIAIAVRELKRAAAAADPAVSESPPKVPDAVTSSSLDTLPKEVREVRS